MLELNNVTLLAIDCVQPEMACRALKFSARGIKFADVKLFTSEDVVCRGITVHRIEKISDLTEYSRFCLKELAGHISTDFMITVHADGFIINPHLWRDEFLEYDYIGAPWPTAAPWCTKSRVGNGGFSFRSRKLMQRATSIEQDFRHEDVLITNICFDHFTSSGCRIAPVEVAMKFALESKIPECSYNLDNCFGFHGKGEAFYHAGEGGQFRDRIALLDTVSLRVEKGAS